MTGIHAGLLRGRYYNFATNSMDLFYQLLLIRRLAQRGILDHTRKCIFEMPYYYFNYDISKTRNTFKIRTTNFLELGDYHHYGETYEGRLWLKQFEQMVEISRKHNVFVKGKHFILTKLRLAKVYIEKKKFRSWKESEIREQLNVDHVWTNIREETIDENRHIWDEITSICKGDGVRITVLVMPFMPSFRMQNNVDIERMRENFYTSLEGFGMSNIEIIDWFDKVEDDKYFKDNCHLNNAGAFRCSIELRGEL